MSGITTIKRTGYLHGGVTHPDGRRGFFKGAEKDSREKGTSMSPGTDSKGNQRDQSKSGQRDDMTIRSFNPNMTNPDGSPNYKQTPQSKPKVTPKNKIKTNPFETYFNYNPVLNVLDKIAKNKFNTNVNAKKREDYLNDLLDTDPDEYNRVMSDLADVNMITGPTGIETQIGPDIRTDYGMPKGPPSQLTSNFEVIDGRKSLGDPAALEILGDKYKDTLQTFDGGEGGDGPQPYLPINYNTGAATIEDVEPYNQFTYDENAFGPGGDSADVTRASYNFNKGGRAGKAEGGIMELRARRAFGGIMDRVTGRKAYGLGSIFKGVKKAVSGVVDATKKVLKSDIGKAALLYAGGTYLGGTAMFGGSGAGFSNFGSRLMNPMGANSFGSLFMNSSKKGILNRAGSLFSKDGALDPRSMVGKKNDGFLDNAIRFGKFGALGYGLTKIPGLNTPKPNEASYMADRVNNKLVDPLTGQKSDPASMTATLNEALENAQGDPNKIAEINKAYRFLNDPRLGDDGAKSVLVANGGRIRRAEGGLMDLGGMEKDYRAEGGFVPIGEYEKKDDVPARLSVNEFVFTADAVRGAGQGDIDKGAEIMENMMENLENGGTVSEESQGNKGAQQMFETSQRLGEVV